VAKLKEVGKVFQLWSVTLKSGEVLYLVLPSCAFSFGDIIFALEEMGKSTDSVGCLKLVSIQCSVFEEAKRGSNKRGNTDDC